MLHGCWHYPPKVRLLKEDSSTKGSFQYVDYIEYLKSMWIRITSGADYIDYIIFIQSLKVCRTTFKYYIRLIPQYSICQNRFPPQKTKYRNLTVYKRKWKSSRQGQESIYMCNPIRLCRVSVRTKSLITSMVINTLTNGTLESERMIFQPVVENLYRREKAKTKKKF